MNQRTRENWHLFLQLAAAQNINLADPRQVQPLVRQFAMLLLKAQPEDDRIEIAAQTLICFPNREFRTKQEYIAYHSHNGAWGDDVILSSTLYALAYETSLFLPNTNFPPYQLFEHPDPVAHIQIANYGAAQGGTHWSLLTEATPGDGNCMYHTLAQQIVRDIPCIAAELNVNYRAAGVQTTPPKTPVITETANPQEQKTPMDEPIAAEVIAAFARQARKDQKVYDHSKMMLQHYDLPQLVQIYKQALTLTEGDTYLARRPHFVTKEVGTDFLEKLLTADEPSNVLKSFNEGQCHVAQEELIHMLAKECWRNPKAATAFEQFHENSVETAKTVPSSCASESNTAAPVPPALPAICAPQA